MTEQYKQYTENSLENDILIPNNPEENQTDNSTMENSSKNPEENENKNKDLIEKIINKAPVDPCITIDLIAIQDEIVNPLNIHVNGENDINDKEKRN